MENVDKKLILHDMSVSSLHLMSFVLFLLWKIQRIDFYITRKIMAYNIILIMILLVIKKLSLQLLTQFEVGI